MRRRGERETMKELTKRDLFNAKQAGEKPESFIGEKITVVAIGSYVDNVTDIESGESTEKPISVIVTKDGHIITSPSPTLHNAVNDLADLCADEKLNEIDIVISHGISNSGRKYLTLRLA